MIHTKRTVTVGKQESIIDAPIILYRGDREVEVEFTLVGNKYTFSSGGNVIESANATHGQLVLNTPSGENMFSEVTECDNGKVVFVITKEMIDELIEVGFYSFQIRLYDSEELVSRVTIPPVQQGFDIRNPIAAEDETNVVDQALVDYSRINKDQSDEEMYTFDWNGDYNKTEWEHHDIISANKLNKIEDALYTVSQGLSESDNKFIQEADKMEKEFQNKVDELKADDKQLGDEIDEVNRTINNRIDKLEVDVNVGDVAWKNEVEERVIGELEEKVNMDSTAYVNINNFGVIGDGVTDITDELQELFNTYNNIYIPAGDYIVSHSLEIRKVMKIISHPNAVIKPIMCDDVIRIYSSFSDINVCINGELQSSSSDEKAAIVIGYNGANTSHVKLYGTRINNMKTNGVIWEQGAMCDFSHVRIHECEYDGIICTDNYDDNNHGLFQNTHIIACSTGLRIQGNVNDSAVLPSRHHVFNNLKVFGCRKNIHIETINNVGTIFLELGSEASELTSTSKGNKISIIETRIEFSRFLDNGEGNVIEGYSTHQTWVTKKSTSFAHTIGDTTNIGLNNTYQDKNNSFVNDFSLTEGEVTYNYAKGTAYKRTDYFQDRVKFAGGLIINYATSGVYTISENITIEPGATQQFTLSVNQSGKGDTLICTLGGGDGYTFLVTGTISEGGTCYCTVYNPGNYAKSLMGFTIRYVLMKHFE